VSGYGRTQMQKQWCGAAQTYVCTALRIDPYFHLSVSKLPVGWRKEWFFLMNDTGTPLPVVMGRCPTV
jgi:hypothetical protein